jgi:hypothetical protein
MAFEAESLTTECATLGSLDWRQSFEWIPTSVRCGQYGCGQIPGVYRRIERLLGERLLGWLT